LNLRGGVLRSVEPFHRARNSRGLSMTIHQWVAPVAETSFTRENKSYRDLIEQAEKLALADLDEPLHISALCRALAVSERTLRKAFHKTYGLPPCRHLRMLRLSEARRALLSADCELTTVTEVAMCFGFVELGRFSVEYRKVFGESPSQTLYRASHTRTFPRPRGLLATFAL
jgi:AraC-like DNA-binding protein